MNKDSNSNTVQIPSSQQIMDDMQEALDNIPFQQLAVEWEARARRQEIARQKLAQAVGTSIEDVSPVDLMTLLTLDEK